MATMVVIGLAVRGDSSDGRCHGDIGDASSMTPELRARGEVML